MLTLSKQSSGNMLQPEGSIVLVDAPVQLWYGWADFSGRDGHGFVAASKVEGSQMISLEPDMEGWKYMAHALQSVGTLSNRMSSKTLW